MRCTTNTFGVREALTSGRIGGLAAYPLSQCGSPWMLGHRISRTLVGELLHGLGFSLQANAKTREGLSHPDRDAQFAFIDAQVKTALAAGEPVISVDAKKKELVGDFKNGGRAGGAKGAPPEGRGDGGLSQERGG